MTDAQWELLARLGVPTLILAIIALGVVSAARWFGKEGWPFIKELIQTMVAYLKHVNEDNKTARQEYTASIHKHDEILLGGLRELRVDLEQRDKELKRAMAENNRELVRGLKEVIAMVQPRDDDSRRDRRKDDRP